MKWILPVALLMVACSANETSDDNSEKIEKFFSTLDFKNSQPVALKKASPLATSHLLTIHGYLDNMSVCNELIAQHEDSNAGSVFPGSYYCQLIIRQ